MELRRNVESYTGYPWHAQNKEKLKEYARKYRENNPEYKKRNAEKAKQDRLNDPEFFRLREFKREMKKYGTNIEWYINKLVEQNGLCSMCGHLSHHHGTIQRLQVDHSHVCCNLKTKSCGKCLRGLLCADCNLLLSYLEKFLGDFPASSFDNHEVYLRNNVAKDSWTYKALKYLKHYAGRSLSEILKIHALPTKNI